MTDEKMLEAFIHSITKPPPVQSDVFQTNCLLGQRIIELREEYDKRNNQPFFLLILENGVEIKLYSISTSGIEVTND